MDHLRVMVTGAGSAVGQAIVKSLHISSLPVRLIGADIRGLSAALFRTEEAVLIPKVEEEGALPLVLNIIRDNRIQAVMIGSEFDLLFFARHQEEIQAKTGAAVMASPLRTVEIADDKWLTMQFFKEKHIPYPDSYLPVSDRDAESKANDWRYPVILKSRTGTSSRNVHVLRSEEEMRYWYPRTPKPMLQKPVRMPNPELDSEYTCSIFKCGDGKILGPFTARRTLQGGRSHIVEVDRFQTLHELLLLIGKNMPVRGSLNIQLMLGPDGPVPFELNARFSGTTAVRAYFGFNEPEMMLKHYLLGETLTEPTVRKGVAIRYDEEVFLDGVGAVELEKAGRTGEVLRWF